MVAQARSQLPDFHLFSLFAKFVHIFSLFATFISPQMFAIFYFFCFPVTFVSQHFAVLRGLKIKNKTFLKCVL